MGLLVDIEFRTLDFNADVLCPHRSHRMKRADNTDVTIEYAVLLIGDTNLNQTIQTIPGSSRNISLLGDNTVLIEWEKIVHAINTSAF
ncbi:hypothetical protein DPMN_189222 [Dreissena polymorpha]|uniref:Uncharacterized protein n=1 Tax=Dreissena polymorpha TaxID=45954 RepID=A0A9D4DTR1_DREPO|nr:hypothetical protein DPMN_189222 [Dreissena polymorpha]